MSDTVDYVIVGAGSAGCVLANRLSQNGKYSVCLLESGPADRNIWIHIPIGYGKMMHNEKYTWKFNTDKDPNLLDRSVSWPRGRTLGGSSSINGLIYVRGQRADFDRWSELGNSEWSWDKCLPYFKKLENNDLGPSVTRGNEGPMHVSSIKQRNKLVERFISGANTLGVHRVDDFNTGDQEGVGYYQLTTRNGLRCSTAKAYLKPVRRRRNLRVETEAHVTRVLFDGTRAKGIRYVRHGQTKDIVARCEVILAAGAIQTPQLLQLSGVGPGALLQQYGIPVVKDSPGVGQNLQDHIHFRLVYQVKKHFSTNDQLGSRLGRARIGLQWLLARSGPLAVGVTQGGLFYRALPDESPTPDVQFHFGTVSINQSAGTVHPFSGCTYSVCQLRPESRGTLLINSASPFDPPSIKPNYLSAERDRRTAVAAVKLARRVAQSDPLRSLMIREHQPGDGIRTDEEILHFCRQSGTSVYHPVGTAMMGKAADPMAVVDDRLRVHGITALRVVDASIMPTLISGNTNATVIMIAEKAADIILEDAVSSVT